MPRRRRRWLRRLAIGFIGLMVVTVALCGWAWASVDRSTIARALWWRDADVGDQYRFPARRIPSGDPRQSPSLRSALRARGARWGAVRCLPDANRHLGLPRRPSRPSRLRALPERRRPRKPADLVVGRQVRRVHLGGHRHPGGIDRERRGSGDRLSSGARDQGSSIHPDHHPPPPDHVLGHPILGGSPPLALERRHLHLLRGGPAPDRPGSDPHTGATGADVALRMKVKSVWTSGTFLCTMLGGAGDPELKSRIWGLFLPRCLALAGHRDARPGGGTRTPPSRGFEVLHEPPVRLLGLGAGLPAPAGAAQV